MHTSIALLLSALVHATPAAPRVVILAAVDDGRPRARNVSSRLGTPVTLYAAVRRGRRLYTDAPVRGARPLKGATFRWSRVEPRLHHTSTPSPNGSNPAYSNSVLFGPRHGKWLGFDNIEYHTTPIRRARRASIVVTEATPTDRRLRSGAGTMRYQVHVTLDGQTWSSPGVEAITQTGIDPSVRRVSFRAADDFVGYLTAYHNVPNLFGSAGKGSRHQTDRFQGADCADVIVGAARLGGARIDYTHAAGLTRYARPVGGLLNVDGTSITHTDTGQPAHLVFGRDVRRGDLMLIDYSTFDVTRRKWDHVAVIESDGGERGRFDSQDRVLHMAYLTGLKSQTLASRPAATIQILRFRRGIQRRFRVTR